MIYFSANCENKWSLFCDGCCKLWQEALQPPGAHLQLQHQVQSILSQRVDGIDNQCYYNVNAI